MSDLGEMASEETRRNTRGDRARTGKAVSAANEGDHGGHNIGPQKQHREWELLFPNPSRVVGRLRMPARGRLGIDGIPWAPLSAKDSCRWMPPAKASPNHEEPGLTSTASFCTQDPRAQAVST